MKNQLKKGKHEFEQKNYKKALKHFENISPKTIEYKFSLIYRAVSLMRLKRYSEALTFLNQLIEDLPEDYWSRYLKVVCYISLKQNQKARETLDELEKFVDVGDKEALVDIARLYSVLNDNTKAMEYANKALAVDENYKPALYEKTSALVNSDDSEEIDGVCEKLVELSDGDVFDLMPAFLLKLFSKDYRGCLKIIDNCEGETAEMMKGIIFESICDDLNVELRFADVVELSVSEAINLMLDFKENGKDHGKYNGVQYIILQCTK